MLRVLVLLLVLANGAYWAWTRGALAPLGLAPNSQREPQRLSQQIRPGALRLLGPEEVRRIEAALAAPPPPKAPECLVAGLFNEQQAASLRVSLGSLPPASWQLESGVEPARWMVYMGKYTDADALARKKTELRLINVKFEDITIAALQPGLSLGSFPTPGEANQELVRLSQRGVRTARVLQERFEQRGMYLRLPAVDDNLRPQIETLKPQLLGKPLRSCS